MNALQNINPVTAFRNLCLAGAATAATAAPAWAGIIDISSVQEAITDGQGDMKTIGGYIVGALVILACAGLIYSMLRKA